MGCGTCLAAACLAVGLARGATADPPSRRQPAAKALPEPVWGVTIDSVDRLPDLEAALTGFSRTLTARIVFDGPECATGYREAVVALRRRAFVMGELWDSYDFKKCSRERYRRRTREYYDILHDVVDLWEVGNEVNGEWAGEAADIVAKVSGAARDVKAWGGATALTLAYNPDCWEKPDHEMFRWVEENLPPRLRNDYDYVLLSYYQDECNALWPEWNGVFDRLGKLFPRARLGFGEVGSEKGDKPGLLRRFYGLNVVHPRYVGGYFWWYFPGDMVPRTKPLWSVLRDAVR